MDRDPRNDHAIDVLVERVIARADGTCEALKALHDKLDHEIELTPRQTDRMVRALGHLGMSAAHVLMMDLIGTELRESGELEPEDDRPVH